MSNMFVWRFSLRNGSASGGAGREIHRDAVHAVAQAGRLRAVVEDVAEMAAATAAMHFGAHGAEREVRAPRAMLVVERTRVRAFGAFVTQHVVLGGVQEPSPFVVGVDDVEGLARPGR